MPPRKKRKKNEDIENRKPASSGEQINCNIKNKSYLDKIYGVSIPADLFQFWDFCCEVNKKNPLDTLSCLNLTLVGPFEILAKKIKTSATESPISYHLHWRFYYDPPELMTVLVSSSADENLFHIGYLRDDPQDDHTIVASNSGVDCKLKILGDNLFAAVYNELQSRISRSESKQKNLQGLSKKLFEYAKSHDLVLESQSSRVKERGSKVVAKTFHGAGIVVPIDENEVGYRPLYESDAKLKKMFAKIDEADNDDIRMVAFDELQEMITYIQFANDECDYGMGLELGMDMFCYGSRYLNKAASRLLTGAYSLLKRDLYTKILEHHIADRRKDNLARLK